MFRLTTTLAPMPKKTEIRVYDGRLAAKRIRKEISKAPAADVYASLT